jgi:16S rRNA (adenine1518-N6/adenine1519-N6)-dimethyltransferase
VLVHYLRQKFRAAIESGHLELIEGDILKIDLGSLHARPVIAGNLPYYITSPILEKTFSSGCGWERAVLMVQAEVAARLTAAPGSRDFGYLSVHDGALVADVLVQVHSAAELLFEVSRGAFHPPPKVDSAVVLLTPRDAAAQLGLPDVRAFLKFAQQCFRMKRKTLRNNLGPAYGIEKIGALPEAKLRAEQLSVPELAALYRKLTGA